jgi:hypothetical protein
MDLKRGQVLRGYKSIACAALALGLPACSMPKLPSLGGPPEQPQEMDCDSLNRERTRLLAVRADLDSPLRSNTDAQREAELTQVNGKLYTVEKAQFAKGCPLVANAPPSPPSAVVQ